ncbi:hypothetical protein J6590_089194 [Homalodisca vitripennis]|nr:hypothetical protein J6590_089194 [Homalodisca vitripennis]
MSAPRHATICGIHSTTPRLHRIGNANDVENNRCMQQYRGEWWRVALFDLALLLVNSSISEGVERRAWSVGSSGEGRATSGHSVAVSLLCACVLYDSNS